MDSFPDVFPEQQILAIAEYLGTVGNFRQLVNQIELRLLAQCIRVARAVKQVLGESPELVHVQQAVRASGEGAHLWVGMKMEAKWRFKDNKNNWYENNENFSLIRWKSIKRISFPLEKLRKDKTYLELRL